jgi:hypothetical protein
VVDATVKGPEQLPRFKAAKDANTATLRPVGDVAPEAFYDRDDF